MLITDTPALARLCRDLADTPYIAVDTEFVGEHTYWPRLCLIQVASGAAAPGNGAAPRNGAAHGVAAAIDPLAGLDLKPLFEVFQAASIVKVFHSGRQDLALFRRVSGRVPEPVFDTQIAAMACGFGDSVAYSTLAASLTGTNINKSMQVTDWGRRPLTRAQVDYALADVVHLCSIYETLKARLAKAEREGWVQDDMHEMASDASSDADPWTVWQRIQVRGADPRTLSVLREVAAWREIYAAQMDVPRSRVARDETLIDIAFRRPRTPTDLKRVRGFANVPSHGVATAGILEAVERAMATPAEGLPRPHARAEISDAVQSQVSLLQALLRLRSDEHGVAQRLVATRSDLEALALDPAGDHAVLRGWRGQIFGDDALALLRGELAMTGHTSGAKVVEIAGVRRSGRRPSLDGGPA